MKEVPAPPDIARLRELGPDLCPIDRDVVLWRIHNTKGDHVVPWNKLRYYGPVSSCRWDPQPPPPRIHRSIGVAYWASDIPTALAERFQQFSRVMNTVSAAPYLTAVRMTRTLRLLDLTDTWPLRAGASNALNTAPTELAREWARAALRAWPDLDGLLSISSLTGRRCMTLFTRAAEAMPLAPDFSQPLSHPALFDVVTSAADEIGFDVIL